MLDISVSLNGVPESDEIYLKKVVARWFEPDLSEVPYSNSLLEGSLQQKEKHTTMN